MDTTSLLGQPDIGAPAEPYAADEGVLDDIFGDPGVQRASVQDVTARASAWAAAAGSVVRDATGRPVYVPPAHVVRLDERFEPAPFDAAQWGGEVDPDEAVDVIFGDEPGASAAEADAQVGAAEPPHGAPGHLTVVVGRFGRTKEWAPADCLECWPPRGPVRRVLRAGVIALAVLIGAVLGIAIGASVAVAGILASGGNAAVFGDLAEAARDWVVGTLGLR